MTEGPLADLDAARCEQALTTRWLGRRLLVLPSAGSTNDVLRAQAQSGAAEGTVVVADVQDAGRGRLGRRWLAPPGTCLLCSLLFRPEHLATEAAAQVIMACALAAAAAVMRLGGPPVELKWPNDLLVRQPAAGAGRPWRKLAGLLAETALSGSRLEFVIVGIGINVNVASADLEALDVAATSMLAETGRRVGRAALLAALLEEAEQRYDALRRGVSPFDEWAARLAGIGETVAAQTEDGPLTGRAEGVDADGALRLRTPDGRVHRLLASDVTLAGPPRSQGAV